MDAIFGVERGSNPVFKFESPALCFHQIFLGLHSRQVRGYPRIRHVQISKTFANVASREGFAFQFSVKEPGEDLNLLPWGKVYKSCNMPW